MSETEWKEIKTSEQMDIFFKRLSLIKERLKFASENYPNLETRDFALIIYQQLHLLYKTQEEHESCISDTSNPSN